LPLQISDDWWWRNNVSNAPSFICNMLLISDVDWQREMATPSTTYPHILLGHCALELVEGATIVDQWATAPATSSVDLKHSLKSEDKTIQDRESRCWRFSVRVAKRVMHAANHSVRGRTARSWTTTSIACTQEWIYDHTADQWEVWRKHRSVRFSCDSPFFSYVVQIQFPAAAMVYGVGDLDNRTWGRTGWRYSPYRRGRGPRINDVLAF